MDPCATISRDPFRAQLSSFGNSADVANSLFRKILRITLFESIFCQLTSRYPFRNFQRIKILQTRVKKIRGGVPTRGLASAVRKRVRVGLNALFIISIPPQAIKGLPWHSTTTFTTCAARS